MKLLLDTHIWIWSVSARERLSDRVRMEIADTGNELWISPLSTWELLILSSKGRIRLGPSPQEWMAKANVQLREAPLTQEIVLASFNLPLKTKDPADRFLAATAQVLGLTLVTSDRMLLGLGQIATLANQ